MNKKPLPQSPMKTTSRVISPGGGITRLLDYLRERIGLDIQGTNHDALYRRLVTAAKQGGFSGVTDYARWLFGRLREPERLRHLAPHVTVGETYFFRDVPLLEVLQYRVLPSLIRNDSVVGDKCIRLWSAGCSTGEEAYTLAIILDRFLQGNQEWKGVILATDVNEAALEKARRGRYRPWSFRSEIPAPFKGYFVATNDGHREVVARIRRAVSFAHLNLIEPTYPSAQTGTLNIDLIVCRNVLMYLDAQERRGVLHRFHRCLSEHGWLALSPVELHFLDSNEWEKRGFSEAGVALVRKRRGDATKDPFRPPPAKSSPPAFPPMVDPGSRPVSAKRRKSVAPRTVSVPIPPPATTPQTMEKPGNAREFDLKPVRQALERGKLEAACECLVSICKTEPIARTERFKRELTELVHSLANTGRHQEARAILEFILERCKLEPEYHFLRATVCREMGEVDEAIRSYRQTLYLDQACVMAHFALGALYQKRGNRKLAVRHLENTLVTLARHPDGDSIPHSDGLHSEQIRRLARHLLEQNGETNR